MILVAAFLLVSSALLAVAPPVQAAAVTTDAATLPNALVGASAVTHEGRTYVFGGRLPDGTYSDDILVYDGSTVRVLGSMPQAAGDTATPGRYSGAAALIGGKIYYFGGAQLTESDINGDGEPERVPRASRDIIEFDPASGSARLTTDKLPLGAWGMSVVVSGNTAYLFGGFTFDILDIPNIGRHDWVLRYNTALGEGSPARVRELDATLPYAVQDSTAVILGRRAFIIGGLSDHNIDMNPCPTYTYYNPDTEQEETKQIEVCLTKRIVSFDITFDAEAMVGIAGDIPYRAQFIGSAVVNGKAYLPGAYLSDGTASASIVEISLVRDVPQSKVIVPVLPRGSFGQAVATDGQTILVIGGRVGAQDDLAKEIVRLDPRPTAPWTPRSAIAQEISGGVRLTWEAPTYNGDSVISGYRIYRTAPGELEEKLLETAALSYEDKDVRPGADYVWRITAVNAAGESAQGARIARSAGIAPPSAVSAFSAFPGNNEVILRWQAPSEIGGSNLTGYRLLRNDAQLAALPADAAEYVDKTVQNGMTYTYQIMARNAKGEGAGSEVLRATPAAVPPAPTNVFAEAVASGDDTSVRITWAPSAERYHVYRANLPGRPGVMVAQNHTQTMFQDILLERGRTYYYTVVGVNEVGASPPSQESAVSLVRKPGAPGEVTALGMDGEIRVSWAPPTDSGDAPAADLRYSIARGQGGQAPRPYRTDLDTTVFVDRFLTPGVEYTYTVTTLNPMSSDPSDATRATARAIQNKPPIALLSALPSVANAGDPIELDASQSSDLDGSIESYTFDFGDGTDLITGPASSVTHAYTRNGTWTASVVVKDATGMTSEVAKVQVIIGEVVKEIDTSLPGGTGTPRNDRSDDPGTSKPALPGPGPALIGGMVALAALALRKRR